MVLGNTLLGIPSEVLARPTENDECRDRRSQALYRSQQRIRLDRATVPGGVVRHRQGVRNRDVLLRDRQSVCAQRQAVGTPQDLDRPEQDDPHRGRDLRGPKGPRRLAWGVPDRGGASRGTAWILKGGRVGATIPFAAIERQTTMMGFESIAFTDTGDAASQFVGNLAGRWRVEACFRSI